MAQTPLEIAKQLRPGLTRLFLLYFRKSMNSHISTAQMSIMMILAEHGPLRISQIAAMEAIRMPTASNAVNQLESMNIVTRVRDVSDRRGVRVELTEKGRADLNQMSEDRSQQLASMVAGLSAEELAQVEELIPVINLILERYSEVAEEEIR
ncbi:MarR family winged helix-turn-helix transcriptional regulator [Corynebacterium heidelbergense]|uniref:MarR family transcriptional regulator n=1 Tax=Corynebacterium heidelbergense TaxID=2055947 RepID=A0A364VBZ1_9CORY|nr:MarR family transcriptional regulator [Corynebacterium heidelbergense]RAV34157.1 MarR family transcriptional regulator [Corynebacterium heidelbergense]WCZ37589.1 putative HTH-type transcriptional regulator YusO [Corynebacterium heidelbergense]